MWLDEYKRLHVGPESAGAKVGICYKYDRLTVTDINVVLGYVDPDYFLGGQIKLDRNVLLAQMNMYKEFIETDNTKGRPLGWQSDRDWEAAIKTMETAGALKPGKKPEEFFTNQFIK